MDLIQDQLFIVINKEYIQKSFSTKGNYTAISSITKYILLCYLTKILLQIPSVMIDMGALNICIMLLQVIIYVKRGKSFLIYFSWKTTSSGAQYLKDSVGKA